MATTIDRRSRTELRLLIEQVLAGAIDNDVLVERADSVLASAAGDDPSIIGIWRFLNASFEDPFRTYRLDADNPATDTADLERCVQFLKTDLKYEWPEPHGCLAGLFDHLKHGPLWQQARRGDESVWPFFRASDRRFI